MSAAGSQSQARAHGGRAVLPAAARHDGYEDERGSGEDFLAPLNAQPRRARVRVDSLSSIGSSVAPAKLPTAKQYRRRDLGSSSAGGLTLGDFDSSNSYGNGRRATQHHYDASDEPMLPSAEGGLEAWLRSQAVSVPETQVDASATRMGGLRPMGDPLYDSKHEDVRSDRGKSMGALREGRKGWQDSAGRSSKSTTRPTMADWEASAIDADAAGLGVPSSSRRREASATSGKSLREWLETTDLDSHIGSESRRRRREGGTPAAGVMSASGVRLREGVRRSTKRSAMSSGSSRQAIPSLDAFLARPQQTSGSAEPPVPSLPSSHSMGAVSFRSASVPKAYMETLPSSAREDASTGAAKTGVDKQSARTITRESTLASPLRSWAKWMMLEKGDATQRYDAVHRVAAPSSLWSALSFAILVSAFTKWCTGLGGWSGKGSSSMHGDLEAQRHWMEITLHLPRSEWYYYDLQYWGLDYPPLTALVSMWCAKVGSVFPQVRAHLALDSSRGSEDPSLILFLRATVLVLDLAIYTPAVLAFLHRRLKGRGRRTRAVAACSVLLQPALILVDHGHFQYNAVMLGFSAAAFTFLYTSLPNPDLRTASAQAIHNNIKSISRRISYEYITAAIFFSLSLCFKQMALYYAPAVFAVMLGRCIGLAHIRFERGLICFIGIGLATTITFAVVFRPWLTSLAQLGQIIHRIFPLARGLFEDKVSNVWCFMSVLPLPPRYKLKNALDATTLARLSMATTLATIALPCAHLFAAAAETVHIEMFLNEDSKVQQQKAERRKAEGSVAGSVTTARQRSRLAGSRGAPSETVGSEIASVLEGTRSQGGAFSPTESALARTERVGNGDSSRPGLSGSTRQDTAYLVASSSPSPAASVLPYALLSTSLAFFLFGFQTHEKSILLPLLPMTLLMSVKADEWGGGAGKTDWEWAVLMNNVAMFSMWPLLKRDQLILQYIVVVVGWNWATGYQPFAHLTSQRSSFVAHFSATVHIAMLAVHALEVLLPHALPSTSTGALARYPDLLAVLTVLLSTPVLGTIWLWAMKRQLEVGFACGIDVIGMARRSASRTPRQQKNK